MRWLLLRPKVTSGKTFGDSDSGAQSSKNSSSSLGFDHDDVLWCYSEMTFSSSGDSFFENAIITT